MGGTGSKKARNSPRNGPENLFPLAISNFSAVPYPEDPLSRNRIRPGGSHMSSNPRHALITGSSRGIGRGIALKLAEEGVRIGVHYYQNESAAKDTLAAIRKCGSDGFVVQCD